MTSLSTVDILERLVAFPTVSRDPNLPLINWIRNYLADHGVASQLVNDDSGRKANLFRQHRPGGRRRRSRALRAHGRRADR